jgi:hypothetical protein
MSKSNITFDYSFKDYGYKRKWVINVTKPLLSTINIDYFKFSLEGCSYYNELVFHCGNIELDFQDLVDSGYGVFIDNNSVIVTSTVFNTLNKISLDPTDSLLPNATNKAYLVSSTLTDNPNNATTEFTSTQYANINTSNNAYVSSTAQQTITQVCNSPTSSGGACVGDCPDECDVYVNPTCITPSPQCPAITNTTSSNTCSYTPFITCTCRGSVCSFLVRTCTKSGSCVYTCDAGNYWNGTLCNSTPSWIFTFQRFTFNLTNYNTTDITSLKYCWEGYFSSTGGYNSSNLLWYNVTNSSWFSFQTLPYNSENTYCVDFNSANMTNILNSTSNMTMFATRGNQSKTGHTLTLYSDFAFLNVTYTGVVTTTTTTSSTTTSSTSTSTSTSISTSTSSTSTTTSTTTTIPFILPIEDKRILCFLQLQYQSDIAKLYVCDLMDYFECYLSLSITNKLLRLTLCVS